MHAGALDMLILVSVLDVKKRRRALSVTAARVERRKGRSGINDVLANLLGFGRG